MTALPDPFVRCPACGEWAFHFLTHQSSPPGVFATWPDEAAPHWRYECRRCAHIWREPT